MKFDLASAARSVNCYGDFGFDNFVRSRGLLGTSQRGAGGSKSGYSVADCSCVAENPTLATCGQRGGDVA